MAFQKIKTKKKYEEISDILLAKIKSGELQPGDRLESVEQLAGQLQVSRSAVREALAVIKTMGLIEIKHGSGTFIKQLPEQMDFPISSTLIEHKQSIPHLLELRKIIEVGTVSSAARNRTEMDLQTLKSILDEMAQVQGDGELGENADFAFHRTIALSSQNPLLVNLLDQVAELTLKLMRETRRISLYSKQTTSEQIYDEHMQIFLAIKQQNPELAELAMYAHLSNVEKLLMTHLEQ